MGAGRESQLWAKSSGEESSDKALRRLDVSLEAVEARSSMLAGEIARDLPDFTVHDHSHSAALWGLAEMIGGPDLQLTPVEGYVFGAAAMIHDLGMASAAYVDGPEAIRAEPRWSDTVAQVQRDQPGWLGKKEADEPDAAVVAAAQRLVLRQIHAEQAERLATVSWTTGKTTYTLIEDSELREALGPTIGKIAHSHWWPVESLTDHFLKESGAPAGFPADWTIRPLLLACLLRLADASHLDASRAPRFLESLRRPGEEAQPHWTFQAHLSQPYRPNDRICFSGTAFPPDEASSWWLCLEALRLLDRECRSVDALLADQGSERFAAKGVAGVDDPLRLAELIPTDGWTPVDARIEVSDVVHLVENLGGAELYGDLPQVPLRELLQNSLDAVRARRTLDGRPVDWGRVTIRLGERDGGGRWLEVEDQGVGMSQKVLTSYLLDFGFSFWGSPVVADEYPGLLGAGFTSVGRFGIGFFSVFMWSSQVRVASRRYDSSRAETNVLEFAHGVRERPLLRRAGTGEQLVDPGTRVDALISNDVLRRLGLDEAEDPVASLSRLCGWLAPAIDVDLWVEADGRTERVVRANDWLDLSAQELIRRLSQGPEGLERRPWEDDDGDDRDHGLELEVGEDDDLDRMGDDDLELAQIEDFHLETIHGESGAPIARIALAPDEEDLGVICIGGLRASRIENIAGVLMGEPATASRQSATPLLPQQAWADWSSAQGELFPEAPTSARMDVANVVWRCGGDPGQMPIVRTSAGALTMEGTREWLADREIVYLLQDAAYSNDVGTHGPLALDDRVVLVPMVSAELIYDAELAGPGAWPPPRRISGLSDDQANSLVGAVIQAAEEAWGGWKFDPQWEEDEKPEAIGEREGRAVVLDVSVLKRSSPS